MIELSPITALMVYLGMTLSCVLFVWIFYYWTARKKTILPNEKKLYVCEFCRFAYLDIPEKNITRCPSCHSYNSKESS